MNLEVIGVVDDCLYSLRLMVEAFKPKRDRAKSKAKRFSAAQRDAYECAVDALSALDYLTSKLAERENQ